MMMSVLALSGVCWHFRVVDMDGVVLLVQRAKMLLGSTRLACSDSSCSDEQVFRLSNASHVLSSRASSTDIVTEMLDALSTSPCLSLGLAQRELSAISAATGTKTSF